MAYSLTSPTDKSIRDPLSASHLTSARSATFWISSKRRGTLAAALNPKSLPGTLPISKLQDQSVSSSAQSILIKFDQQPQIANMSANGDHEMGDAVAGAEIDAPVKPEKQRLRLVRDP